MCENFLRKDFRFDMYLAYCYSKVLGKLFQITMFSVLLLIVTILILSEIIQSPDNLSIFMYTFLSVAILDALFVWVIQHKMQASMESLVIENENH